MTYSTPRAIDLSGRWTLGSFDGQRGDNLERVLEPGAAMGPTWEAMVPGDVHETLIEKGVIQEPAIGLNSLHCQWVSQRVWFYRRTFTNPQRKADERIWITFESLDTAAQIFLNGREIGSHANRFLPFRAEITDHLADGGNHLVVKVESGVFWAMNRSAEGLGLYLDNEFSKRPWLRKVQSSFGWDWAPRLLTVGIPGPVYLEICGSVRVGQFSIYTELSDDLECGKVIAKAITFSHGAEPVRIRFTVAIDELQLRLEKEFTISPGENEIAGDLEVPAPELWWPRGHGGQKLYQVAVTVSDDRNMAAKAHKHIGFRDVRINQDRHPDKGRYFVAEINHKPIFVKGANFVPADIIDRRVTAQGLETLIERAVEANFNCLRVWGGGLYQSDTFYELCDAHGLLVWQDFIFACAKYPIWDPAFLGNVQAEATYQVRRLAHHPSLFVWCGNNENEFANVDWDSFKSGPRFPDHALYHIVLPQILRAEDPSRFYIPSSPYSPDGLPPNDWDTGDQHPWSVGFAETDFRHYRQMTCRFPNEGGFLGPAALPTVRACLTDGAGIGSFAWEHHENAVSYWGKKYSPDEALEQWLGIGIRQMNLEEYVYYGGLVQGEALAEYIKNFRRRKFDSASAIFWMYNDVWPAVRSWTIVDYYLRRTPSFHPVRRAFLPVTIVVIQEGERVCVYGVNDGGHWCGHLRFGLCALAGGYPYSEEIEVTIPANESVRLAEFDLADWEKFGVSKHVAFALLYEDDRLIAQDRLILPFFREMEWQWEPRIEIEWDGVTARFSCDCFAWNVCLDLDGERNLPDNFFDLFPGVAREFSWPREWGAPTVLHTGNGISSGSGSPCGERDNIPGAVTVA